MRASASRRPLISGRISALPLAFMGRKPLPSLAPVADEFVARTNLVAVFRPIARAHMPDGRTRHCFFLKISHQVPFLSRSSNTVLASSESVNATNLRESTRMILSSDAFDRSFVAPASQLFLVLVYQTPCEGEDRYQVAPLFDTSPLLRGGGSHLDPVLSTDWRRW